MTRLPSDRLPYAARRWGEHLSPARGGAAATRAARSGFTLVEFAVAMVLLGIAMSGLFPLVVMHSRVLRSLERRDAVQPSGTSGPVVYKWYLVPFSDQDSQGADAWARKLGVSALVKYADPGPPTPPQITYLARGNPIKLDAPLGGLATYYSEATGDWWDDMELAARKGYQRRPAPGTTTSATWTFNVAVAGLYQVQATGLVPGTPPADCSYTLTYSTPAPGAPVSVPVSIPATLGFGPSSTWQPLAIAYFSQGAVVTVQLNAGPSGSAIANGVQLVPYSVSVKPGSLTALTNNPASVVVEIQPATF